MLIFALAHAMLDTSCGFPFSTRYEAFASTALKYGRASGYRSCAMPQHTFATSWVVAFATYDSQCSVTALRILTALAPNEEGGGREVAED